jgi:dihydroxyacetone kinase
MHDQYDAGLSLRESLDDTVNGNSRCASPLSLQRMLFAGDTPELTAGGGSHHLVAWVGYFGTRDGDGDSQTCMAVTRVADRIYDLSLG